MSVLYAHDAASLLPLLTLHLPHSLPVVGSVLSNTAPVMLHTTFAPGAPRPDLWVAIAFLPAPSEQTRVFCSAESGGGAGGGAGSAGRAGRGGAGGANNRAAEAEAAALVCAAVRECIARHPANAKAGCVAEHWRGPLLRAAVGAQKRGVCTVFLGPEDGEMAGSADAEATRELVLGPGQAGDEDVIYETSTLRSKDYYRARLPQTTTLRPRAAPGAYVRPVSFIETHADGSLGALWTHGKWRRRGLALRVTAARICTMRDDDERARAWVVVYVGNEESERLWEDKLR